MHANVAVTGVQPRRDWRVLWVGISLIVLAIAGWEAAILWRVIGDQNAIGVDLAFYHDMGLRWLETGTFYTERQLAGPYETTTLVDNLYPPHALFLFVPFVYLPALLWWAIPLGLVAFSVWRLRPVPWSWPVLAVVIALPKTISATIYGNSDLWVAAAVAAGVMWSWPAVFATFKPSLGVLALIGVRRRSWWIAAVALATVGVLPFVPLWLEWPRVILNSTSGALYSIGNIPFMLLPVLAWLVSRDRSPFARVRRAA